MKFPPIQRKLLDTNKSFAHEVAAYCHRGVVRKFTGDAYIVHPVRNATRIEEWNPVDDGVPFCVSLLHDCVEDAPHLIDIEGIVANFGEKIARGVWWLTDDKNEEIPRAERKKLDNKRLSRAPGWVKNIKILDVYDNAPSIAENDPGFAAQYVSESYDKMLALQDGSNPVLWSAVMGEIESLRQKHVLKT